MFFSKKKKEETKQNGAAAATATQSSPSAPPSASSAATQPAAVQSGKHPHHVLGQIASLMASSPAFNKLTLADLSQLAIPAIRSNQVAVAEAKDKSGNLVPVGAVVWACVSPAVDQRLTSQASPTPQLSTEEWKSGDIPWIILAVGSEKACQATIAQISQKQLGGRSVKVSLRDSGGKMSVRELSAAA